jgi:hypothetical protein
MSTEAGRSPQCSSTPGEHRFKSLRGADPGFPGVGSVIGPSASTGPGSVGLVIPSGRPGAGTTFAIVLSHEAPAESAIRPDCAPADRDWPRMTLNPASRSSRKCSQAVKSGQRIMSPVYEH